MKRKQTKKTYCTYTLHYPEPKKGVFLFVSNFICTNPGAKKILFFFIFLLKQHSSLTRGYSLNFQAKIINQNGENPLKEESILHQSSIYSSSSSFNLISFKFYFHFFVDYFIYTNHFIAFLYFLWEK